MEMAVAVGAAGAEIVGERRGELARQRLVLRRRRVDRRRAVRARRGAARGAGGARAQAIASRDQSAKSLRDQRQVEQPFAGIVDDVEMELAAAEACAQKKDADS